MLNEVLQFIKTHENLAERYAQETKVWQSSNKENCVYLYGAGYLLQYYYLYLKKYGIEITAILDTYKEGIYQNVPILKYDSFLRSSPDNQCSRIFISTAAAAKEIIPKLKEYFPAENILFVDYAFQLGLEGMTLEEYRKYLLVKWSELVELYNDLKDKKSKATLVNIIKAHVSGNPYYLSDSLDKDLGYPKDIIKFSKNDVLVELGTNDGSTFLDFTRRCPQYSEAYLFEPEPFFQESLQKIVESEKSRGKKVHIIKKGAWDCETKLCFLSTEGKTGSFVKETEKSNNLILETTTVDHVVSGPFTYMKMDIEGAELNALRGAEKHILSYKPNLGISVYHKPTDILDVWNYLRSLVPDYHFYLRNHTLLCEDIILYAI